MKTIKNFLLRDWRAKLLTLIGAVILWATVAANQSGIVSFPGKIPIQYSNIKDGLVAISDVDAVQIKISAESTVLRQLKEENFTATVNLSNLDTGTYQKGIDVSVNKDAVKIISVSPSQATIRIEKKISKDVPVRIRLDGKTADEFIASDTVANLAEVKISGPESIVKTISEVIAPIKLGGENTDFEKTAKLFAYTANGEEIKNITISPGEINAKIRVSPAGEAKTVGIKVNTKGNTTAGFWISSITTDPEVVTISGSRVKISSTKYLETEDIDISGLAENKSFTTDLIVPSGLKIEESPAQVKVQVTVSRNQSTKDFTLTPKFSAIGNNLNVSSSDPAQVVLTLSGNQKDLDAISTDQLTLDIPLSSYTQGNYEIQLKNEFFHIPTDVDIDSFAPVSLKLTLSLK